MTGPYKPAAMVAALMRTNLTQQVAGDIFGCSQATVSRRWDLLRPATGQVLASCIPDPRQILRGGVILIRDDLRWLLVIAELCRMTSQALFTAAGEPLQT